MPFTGNTHSLPAGSLATNLVIADATQHNNAPLTDISAALTIVKTEASLSTTKLSDESVWKINHQFNTVAEMQAANLSLFAIGTVFLVQGYSVAGVGRALWKRIAAPGVVKPWHKLCGGGAYVQLDVSEATPDMFCENVLNYDAAFQYLRDWVSETGGSGLFLSKTYPYTISPNWAVENSTFRGSVGTLFRYTGTGDAVVIDAGAASQVLFDMRFGPITVHANLTSGRGLFLRSIHHSNIDVNVIGCGSTSYTHELNFAVCSVFNLTCSANHNGGAWPNGVAPTNGILVTRRSAGDAVTDCIFNNPIFEGINGTGITLDYAVKNHFINGTSEGNAGLGIVCTSNSKANTFDGCDLEINVGGDISDAGFGNIWRDIYSDSTATFTAASINAHVEGGFYKSIVDAGVGNSFENLTYAFTAGGTFTGAGTRRRKAHVLNGQTFVFDREQQSGDLLSSTSLTSGVTTTVLTLPSADSSWYEITVNANVSDAVNYSSKFKVLKDGTSTRVVDSSIGPLMPTAMSGLNVDVTQSSGVSITVLAAARILS